MKLTEWFEVSCGFILQIGCPRTADEHQKHTMSPLELSENKAESEIQGLDG